MKIGFVSLMHGAIWGGSEELWSKTALLALTEGHTVVSLTYGWSISPPKIQKLQEAGVITKFWFDDSSSLLTRIAVKLGLKTAKSKLVPAIDVDVFVVSNGSIWDFIRRRTITDKIIETDKPYIIISHSSYEYGDIVTDTQREYGIKVLQKASKLFFVSERNRKNAERQLAYSIKNFEIIGNPINIKQANIKPFPASDKLLIASVGMIECSVKGQDILLEALSGEAWKNRDFLLRIYGTGPHVAHLRNLIVLYNLQDKVILEGHVSDIDRIWESNQALVLSSSTEGAPLVVVEAMLSGRAVLATDVGDVDRYVVEGHTGFIVEVAKAKYLAAGLEKLWNNRVNLNNWEKMLFIMPMLSRRCIPKKAY